jgi:LuxR family transcriptional regulator, maltose regulon positive regulatory protein
VKGLKLSEQDIVALDKRTEGWVVGLQMAGLSLQGQTDQDMHDFVSSFTGDDRYIADYLLDQVLHCQSPYIQRFLMQTSILDRLCGPLCDAVMAGEGILLEAPELGSQRILEYLENAGLFIIPLDHRRYWYRYHHLFADLLRSRLQTSIEPPSAVEGDKTGIAALHLRASTWFEREGLVTESMDHAIAATDYERAANLIEQHYKETMWVGEFGLVCRWLEALPKALIRSRPFLCLIYGALLVSHSTERAEAWLQAAEDLWKAQPKWLDRSVSPPSLADREVFAANMANIRATITDIKGVPTKELIAFMLQALEKTPEKVPSVRASMLQRLGWYHLTLGDEGAAECYFTQSKKLGEIVGHHGNTLNVTIGQAVIAWGRGRLRDAVAICRETLQSVIEPLERSGRRLLLPDIYSSFWAGSYSSCTILMKRKLSC